MGEIAEMMLEGMLCEGCGEYLGAGDGYPTRCESCEPEQHAARRERPKDKPFIVKNEKAFGALRFWLKDKGCNTFSWNDRRHIQVGYDSDPNNDWSRGYSNRGFILVLNESLFDRILEEIPKAFRRNKAYGWTNE